MRSLRAVLRLGFLLAASAAAMAHFTWIWLRYRGRVSLGERAQWLHRWCAWGIPRLGLHVAHAQAPRRGLLVSNHLSYLDILAFSALTPCVFVAKCEVRSWPVFGWLARLAGAIFVDRERRMRAPEAVAAIEQALGKGALIVLFPEGTTSDGSSVLPFYSALFEAAVRCRSSVAAAHISYSLDDASGTEVCWWGDASFVPHLISVLGKKWINANISVAARARRFSNRKQAAAFLRLEVKALGWEATQQRPARAVKSAPSARRPVPLFCPQAV